MKNISIILSIIIFLMSCIDIIKSSDEDFYESVYVQGSGWFQFYVNNENENLELVDDFTLQIWFSGQEETNNEAPCIVSFKGNTSTIAIYRNPNINNMIMIYQDDELIRGVELDNIDLSQHTNFYLLSIIKIQNQIIIYVNDNVIKEEGTIENGFWDWVDLNNDNLYNEGEGEEFVDEKNGTWDEGEEFIDTGIPLVIINNDNLQSIIGTNIKSNNIPKNLWYGYIDEIRLWDIALHDTIINLHNQYPNKVSSSYNDSYLSSLHGFWDFKINTSENNISNIFQDVNDNLNYTILYTLESMSNELSELGR